MSIRYYVIPIIFILLCACGEYYPKPKAFLRVDAPASYQAVNLSFACFETAAGAEITPERKNGNDVWVDVFYLTGSTAVYGSYCRFGRGGLTALTDDFYSLMERNVRNEEVRYSQYEDPARSVYAHVFCSDGTVASPVQFFVTDSVVRYFCGSVYFTDFVSDEMRAPYIHFIDNEVVHLLETFNWK